MREAGEARACVPAWPSGTRALQRRACLLVLGDQIEKEGPATGTVETSSRS
ncbi:hypothetical protein GCM10009646_30260 [Streptomyces aureus]